MLIFVILLVIREKKVEYTEGMKRNDSKKKKKETKHLN